MDSFYQHFLKNITCLSVITVKFQCLQCLQMKFWMGLKKKMPCARVGEGKPVSEFVLCK